MRRHDGDAQASGAEMSRLTTIRCLTVLAALGLSSLAASAQVEAVAEHDGRWSEEIWTSAKSGDTDQLDAMLRELHERESTPLAVGIAGDIQLYNMNIAKREADREARTAEAHAELGERLSEALDDPAGFKLGEALVLTMELIELHGGPLAASDLMADPLVSEAVNRADAAAKQAEAAGQWLKASELFYRLHVLFDVDKRYQGDIDRLGRRLSMIRLYAPEHYWSLRNARRLEAGESELPPYNAMGDSYEEKLKGLDKWVIIQSVGIAGTRHVDGQALRQMIAAGIDGVETMATTSELAQTFTGLQDSMATQAFLTNLHSIREKWQQPETGLSQRDLSRLMDDITDLSTQTVGIPKEAVLHEFGNGAMTVLDDYSTIIWPDQVRRFERNTRGEFIGIGVSIQHDELMQIKVVTPLEGTPAQRAGVRSDDVIVSVDGQSTAGFTLDQAVDVITGPKNTKVTIGFEREEDGETVVKDITIVRAAIKLRSVKGWKRTGASEEDWNWFVDPDSGIGYVRLSQFTASTARDLSNAIDEMTEQGLNGLVLDLRFNPGGLLDQAVDVVGEFVPSGVVVTTENADGVLTATERIRHGSGRLGDIPVAILVNPGSASASEIVAGALQDYAERGQLDAIVIGQRSFGKGSVQNAWPLQTKARAMLKVTTQYYRLPNGRLIHRRPGLTEWGIEPDLVVDMLPSQNQEAISLRREADVQPLDENGQIIVSDEPKANPDDLLTKGIDLQLETAVVLLKCRAAGLQEARAVGDVESGSS
ncbi:MAG: S41 family peptidase [Planctomycetota bacterium]|nr:S41 family peptidase [Planctomycetota bacterium]